MFFAQGIHNPGRNEFTEYVDITGEFFNIESAVEEARKASNFEIICVYDNMGMVAQWSISDNQIQKI